jgi:hypothetical protein
MTIQELISMGIALPDELPNHQEDIDKSISQAVLDYATIKIDQEKNIHELKLKREKNSSSIESPIDYEKTKIKPLPLSADSLKMDSQYFSFDENMQKLEIQESIKKYVRSEIAAVAPNASNAVSDKVVSQVDKQKECHDIDGTLIIIATCTHQNAAILSPLVLDVDKSIRIWNNIFPEDKIKIDDLDSLQKIVLDGSGDNKEKTISIISGATYGSCFVGMVHYLKEDSTRTNVPTQEDEKRLKDTFKIGRWIAEEEGKVDIDSSILNSIKRSLLSTQRVISHINVITVGAIPTITASTIPMGVKIISDVNSLANKVTAEENKSVTTVSSEANTAKSKAEIINYENSKNKNIMLTLSNIESEKNKTLDINTMLGMFENYVTLITKDNKDALKGTPISYYIRPITKTEIVKNYLQTYYPTESPTISKNDKVPLGNATKTESP